MHGTEVEAGVAEGLAMFFGALGLMNAYYAWRLVKLEKNIKLGIAWTIYCVYLFGTAIESYNGRIPSLSVDFRDAVDNFIGPVTYFLISVLGFFAIFYFRKTVVRPFVAFLLLNASLLFIGLSLTDTDFREIMAKPDNVPISMLIYSVAFTSWIALRTAVQNDERIDAGQKPIEAEGSEKVLTWPDLVYTEMLAMIIGSAALLIWSICLKAPLEPPASAVKIPNPSKAPWYFLGLQEMLVYFDPWLAGVVLPTYIIIGLCAIPYIDYNKLGNGYYTFKQRPFAILTFTFGFVVLWVVLIVLGTLLRGPNWNFYGPYEFWSPYKTVALNNINLSDYFWIDWLGQARPDYILVREAPGILFVLAYFFILPFVLMRLMNGMAVKMGAIRFMTMANILLMMAFLPLKMVLRWTFNLKYIVNIPEFFFNI